MEIMGRSCGHGLVAGHDFAEVATGVQFPLPAPFCGIGLGGCASVSQADYTSLILVIHSKEGKWNPTIEPIEDGSKKEVPK